MINKNAFISVEDAKERFSMEFYVASCSDYQFYQTVREKDFSITSLNVGIIVKYCISAERLNKFVEIGLDIYHPEAALMALGNNNYEVAKYVLGKYNVFQTI